MNPPYERLQLLDHGYIQYIDHMGSDETVIEAARMSTGKGFVGWEPGRRCVVCGGDSDFYSHFCVNNTEHRWADHKGDASLLEFLYKNQHLTPFEMCELHIEVYAPIFVLREWHRHRTFSFNEFSGRYAQMPNEHYVPEPERVMPVQSANKQASSTVKVSMTFGEAADRTEDIRFEQQKIYAQYETLLSIGVPKEVARVNTPVARYSKMRAKTDLRNWLGFLKLRMAPDAQWEIRQYANAVAELVKQLWPRTWALFDEYTLGAHTFSKKEMAALRAAWGDMGPEMQQRMEAVLGGSK